MTDFILPCSQPNTFYNADVKIFPLLIYKHFFQQQEAHSRQEEAQRQEVNRQHQEAVQRQQQEEYRQVT